MKTFTSDYSKYKETKVRGRYLVNEQITEFLKRYQNDCLQETVGRSVQKRPIEAVTIGKGEKKILMWSQMHGNESTTTKAVLDLLNFLNSNEEGAQKIIQSCTLKIVPILNPDGAQAYTRFNANQVDLNRDAQDRSQPESKTLRAIYDSFQPDFCFNLHDQRTIYNVGTSSKPATVSFLSPSFDVERSVSKNRLMAMQLIAAMNETLQKLIPGQVGRYDDAFNANCVGDTFQMLQTPTVLFEAGHFQKDYERERTREYIFWALLKALDTIANGKLKGYDQKAYEAIPENGKRFFDILVKNVPNENTSDSNDIGILYKEILEGGKIAFVPCKERIGNLGGFLGHETYDFLNSEDLSYVQKSNFYELLKT